MSPKWNGRFLALAEHVAGWSKDPSTQVGAIVVNPDTRVVHGMGYNGFPRGVDDHPDRYANREFKYTMVVHAEPNAILEAGDKCKGATIFVWPLFTCNECAKLVIQSGIKKVCAPKQTMDRWKGSMDTALLLYEEAGVEVEWLD